MVGLKLKKKLVPVDKDALSRRGKKSRRKGASYERDIAKIFKEFTGFDFARTPQSGGFCKKSEKADDFRGDILPVDKSIKLKLHIECKSHKTWSIPSWIKQSESDCPKGRLPIVIFHQYRTSTNYVLMGYENFCSLMQSQKTLINKKPVSNELLPKELWKPIYGFTDYFVSNLGRVKSLRAHNGKISDTKPAELILKAGVGSSGYLNVVLRQDGKSHTKRVHQLVAEHFLEKVVGNILNHIDGNKLNNCVHNLEYVSYSENIQHAYDTNLRPKGESIKCAKLSDKEALDIRVSLGFGTTLHELSAKYSVSEATISRLSNLDYRNPYKLFVLCKNQEKWSLKNWLNQAQEDCPKNRMPLVIMKKKNTNLKVGENGNQQNLVILDLHDFLSIVDKTKVIERVDE